MTGNRKALNRWARDFGYSDFDAYIQAGGSILDARNDIRQRISKLAAALNALDSSGGAAAAQLQPDAAQAQLPVYDLPDAGLGQPDPDNAHIQGAETP